MASVFRTVGALAIAMACGLLGCVTEVDVPGAPVPGKYKVNFGIPDAALLVDTVQVLAFDSASSPSCSSLLAQLQNNLPLPKAIALDGPRPICDLFAGKGAMSVPLANMRVLVDARRADGVFMGGCTDHDFGSTPEVSVSVTYISSTVPSPSACTTMAQKCARTCK
jgi:hypothetical protein